ncbi:ImpA family type VI secretion-associated protein [Escherichia coli]|uniref:ImpA family type VI secretion-associated protein n=1 Tax=Escherichia coli TaxID=562 RepID=A0A484YVM3_ECOLX|nr:ImpA family type VI secretion-associated protein [Escherichia coli]
MAEVQRPEHQSGDATVGILLILLSHQKNSWQQTGKPAKNQKVQVTRGDGSVVEMTTDEQGRLPIQSGLFVESIKIDLPDSQEN